MARLSQVWYHVGLDVLLQQQCWSSEQLSCGALSLVKLLEAVSVIVIYCSAQHGHFCFGPGGGALPPRVFWISEQCWTAPAITACKPHRYTAWIWNCNTYYPRHNYNKGAGCFIPYRGNVTSTLLPLAAWP